MTVEMGDTEQVSTEQAAEAAAFESSFHGVAEEKAATIEPVTAEVKTEAEPAKAEETSKEDAAPQAPSPKVDDHDVHADIRKLYGRIGTLNDQLQQALKAKESEGKPPVLSKIALKRMADEFPEMAHLLQEDIAEAMAGIGGKPDPVEVEAVAKRIVQDEVAALRRDAVTDRHENWEKDLWVKFPDSNGHGERTPEYSAWLKTMSAEEVNTFESSQSPSYVNRKLDQFYSWKASQSKANTEKQARLLAAVTPTGTAKAGKQTMSEEEAARKAFEDAFNS